MKFTARDRLRILTGMAALPVVGCSGGGSSGSAPSPVLVSPPPPPPPPQPPAPAGLRTELKTVFESNFLFGAAIQARQVDGSNQPLQDLVTEHHSSITAEFEMKAAAITNSPGQFDFTASDALVDFAEASGIAVRGHALLWYQSTPSYMVGGTPTVIRDHLEAWIDAIMTRYKGRIYAWDVVNEPTADNGADATAPYRNDDWFANVGKDYLDWAFQAARAADPDAKLFINDYNTELAGKRGRYMTIIRDLLDRGIPLDGVGHQAHININTNADDVLAAIDEVDALNAGLENHITELDVSVYNDPSECFGSGVNCATGYGSALSDVPETIQRAQMQLYRNVLNGCVARSSVTSVSLWGVSDAATWLDRFPIDRANHPLLFDRNYEPKPPAFALTDPDYTF